MKKIILLLITSFLFANDYALYSSKHFIMPEQKTEVGCTIVEKFDGLSKNHMNIRYGVAPNLEIQYFGVKYKFYHDEKNQFGFLFKLTDSASDNFIYTTAILNRFSKSSLIIDSGIIYEDIFQHEPDYYTREYNYKFFIYPKWKYNDNLYVGTRATYSQKYYAIKDAINDKFEMPQETKNIGLFVDYFFNSDIDINLGLAIENKDKRFIKNKTTLSNYNYYNNKLIMDFRWRF